MNWLSTLLIFILLFGPCNSNQKTDDGTAENKKDAPEKSLNPPDEHPQSKDEEQFATPKEIANLIITFSSRGEGINYSAKKSLDEFINKFESDNNIQVNFHLNSWGREGETDYCFSLKNLTSSQQNDFADRVKELLVSANLVTISENKPCTK